MLHGNSDDDVNITIIENMSDRPIYVQRVTKMNEAKIDFFDNATEFLCIADLCGNILECNTLWKKTFNCDGAMIYEIVYPGNLSNQITASDLILKGEELTGVQTKYQQDENQFFWCQWNISINLNKNVIYVSGVDITYMKKLEERLKENEERWQFALEGSDCGVWDWNMDTDKCFYSNDWKLMLGYEEKDNFKRFHDWHNLIHPEDVERVEEELVDTVSEVNHTFVSEHRLKCKDGSYKWVLSRGKIMDWREKNQPLRMTGTQIDITKKKYLVEELKRLTHDYEIVFNGTQDALFLVTIDPFGRYSYARINSVHEKLTGVSSDNIVGSTPKKLYGEVQGEIIENNYRRCVNEKCIIQYEETLVLPSGKKTFHTTLFPVIYDGKVVNIVGSGRDITEQKMIEDSRRIAEEKVRTLNESIAYESLKTEFFANLSHELRTPLNVIFSSMQMLNVSISNYSDPTAKNIATKYFKSMKQNCFRLLRLVNNLIDISKVDSGYFDLNLENTDVVSLVENITLSVAEYIESKSISLIFDTEIEEKIIAVDPEKMERIILNLLSNATKFTDSGGQVLVYICEKEDKIVISIKDSGIGIPEEKLEVIFDRFTQVDKSLTRKREGSGIGLYLVKSLVELHGGNITVNSRVGEGSEFIIGLPVKLVDESEEKSIYKDNCDGGMVERINIEFSDIYS